MKFSYVLLLTATAVLMLEAQWTQAAPSPQPEDVLKTLQQLDRLYSAVARPSVRSGDMSPKVQRAINMLRLQHLDRLYADRSRPRFGKRGRDEGATGGFDYEHQEYPNRRMGPVTRYVLDLDPLYR